MKPFRRVWVDGCFDVCHFGHYNMIRQSASIADEVYVGIHNDDEIRKNKGPPVYTQEERLILVNACKWVAKAIPDAPFTTDITWLDEYGCEAAVHGDDLVLNADGVDCYAAMKAANRFAVVPRTKAISTTNLIQRMLCLPESELPPGFDKSLTKAANESKTPLHTYIPTTRRIAQFSNQRSPPPGAKVVYVDGTFDLLHPGHVSFLKKAKEMGDFLVVGVHDDPKGDELKTRPPPIMTLQERVLNVLAIKYVDDVIIGAPYTISKELIDQVEPTFIVEGSSATRKLPEAMDLAKELGLYRKIDSDFPEFTAKSVIFRILENYSLYNNRNAAKIARENSQDVKSH